MLHPYVYLHLSWAQWQTHVLLSQSQLPCWIHSGARWGRSGTGCLCRARSKYGLLKVQIYQALPVLFDVLGYHVSDLSVHCTGFTYGYGLLQALVGLTHQELARLSHLPDQVSLIEVNVKPVFVYSYVEINDVPVLQGTIVGNAMADDFIDRRAKRLREFVVVKRRWVCIVADNEVVDCLIDEVSCHSCLHEGVAQIQCLSGEHCHLPNDCDFLFAFDFNIFLEFGLLFLLGDGGEVVVRFGYMFGDGAPLGDDSWPEGPCKLEPLVSFLGLLLPRDVHQLVHSPALLEALLVAEVGGVQVHLLADGTKHGRGLAAPRRPAFIIGLHS